MSKCTRDNEDLKVRGLPRDGRKGTYQFFSCAMGCAGAPGLFNAPFDSALGRGDKGGESECVRVWEETGIRTGINL